MRTIHELLRVAVITACLAALALAVPSAQPRAGTIDKVTPSSGRAGDRVTIAGRGFGAGNVLVVVGGIPAVVLTATGHSITFVVPPGLPTGIVSVTATNPGGLVGRIGFRVLGGGVLQGDPTSPASDAIVDLPPVAAPASDIAAGIIMTRLDIRISLDATVGEVNAALTRAGAEIVSMTKGFLAMTIAVPRPSSVEALKALAGMFESSPGIVSAVLAVTSANDELPSATAASIDHQLLPARFPAAWNARNLVVDPATGACRQPRVPVLVADQFVRPTPLVADIGFAFVTFSHEIPSFIVSPPDESVDDTHGYDVTLTLASLFNPETKTGANPFSQCLDITGVQIGSLSGFQEVDRLVQNFPTGKFILNYSRSWGKVCADAAVPPATEPAVVPCEPRHFGSVIPDAYERAANVLYWKERSFARWPDFLVATSAGNSRDEEPAAIYPVLGTAGLNSFISAGTFPDPFLGFADNVALWHPVLPGFASLAATSVQAFRLRSTIVAQGLDQVGGADNVLIVGSTTRGNVVADLVESAFSNSGPDVSAVGEDVAMADLTSANGTSFSAPQVAGLASYLWLLSPQLRSEPASVTRRAIVANTRNAPLAANLIDAYATVLSLDAPGTPTPSTAPIRLAILDVSNDGRFDELDLTAYRAAYVGVPDPATPDYGRYDLNGDGFTGGSRRDRFDLDRLGSSQFGAASYSTLAGGYDETSLTDVDILCFYAHSPMYDGSVDIRNQLLQSLCAVAVSVNPPSATVMPGGSLQFAATVTGTQDPRVSWSATGGTITPTGLFTAGTTAGSFRVRAISVVDPNAFADAMVTITTASTTQVRGPYDGEEERGIIDNATIVGLARWQLQPVGSSFRVVRETGVGVYFCAQTGISPFQCSPTFDLINGAFSATGGSKTVAGSVSNGRLQFVLEEPCVNNNFEIVRCRTRFDGRLLVLQLAPALLDFGTVAVGTSSAPQALSITNLGLLPTRVFVNLSLGFSIVGNSCDSGTGVVFMAPEGTTCTLSVQFSPPLPGSFGGPVGITADGGPAISGVLTLRGQGN